MAVLSKFNKPVTIQHMTRLAFLKLRDIPNVITCIRLIIIIPFIYFLLKTQYTAAFYLFIAAGISDGADGVLARKFHWESKFGAFADPMADKLLVTCSYLILGYLSKIPWWLMVLVLFRDIVISAGSLTWYLLFAKIKFEPTMLSKANTTLQIFLVLVVLYNLVYDSLPPILVSGLIVITACTTILSMFDYVWVYSRKAYLKKRERYYG